MRKFNYFLCGRLFPFAFLLIAVSAAYLALSIWLPRALAPVALVERLFSFATGVAVLYSHSFAESKAAKLLLLVLFPWTGAILCLLHLRHGGTASASAALPDGDKIISLCRARSRSAGGTCQKAEYFPTGREACEKLIGDLKRAQKSIFLEYYIIARGVLWNEILSVLEEKANGGVDVRLIYDDFGCALTLPHDYPKRLRAKNIQTLVYRPLRFPTFSAGERDHRKLTVIDGKIAYTGGINLADEYIGEKIRFGHWKDTAVRVTGAVAGELYALFCETWKKLGGKSAPPLSDSEEQDGIPCSAFADGTGGARTGIAVHAMLIYGAEKSISLCTPYFAPDDTLISALAAAAGAGVDVRVMLPHVPDKKWVLALSRAYARRLSAAGVKFREYTAGFLHAKSMVIDGERCVVSSYNFDFRSMYLQAECGVYLKSKAVAENLERDFSSVWETGTELKKATFGERFAGGVMRLIAPLV